MMDKTAVMLHDLWECMRGMTMDHQRTILAGALALLADWDGLKDHMRHLDYQTDVVRGWSWPDTVALSLAVAEAELE